MISSNLSITANDLPSTSNIVSGAKVIQQIQIKLFGNLIVSFDSLFDFSFNIKLFLIHWSHKMCTLVVAHACRKGIVFIVWAQSVKQYVHKQCALVWMHSLPHALAARTAKSGKSRNARQQKRSSKSNDGNNETHSGRWPFMAIIGGNVTEFLFRFTRISGAHMEIWLLSTTTPSRSSSSSTVIISEIAKRRIRHLVLAHRIHSMKTIKLLYECAYVVMAGFLCSIFVVVVSTCAHWIVKLTLIVHWNQQKSPWYWNRPTGATYAPRPHTVNRSCSSKCKINLLPSFAILRAEPWMQMQEDATPKENIRKWLGCKWRQLIGFRVVQSICMSHLWLARAVWVCVHTI